MVYQLPCVLWIPARTTAIPASRHRCDYTITDWLQYCAQKVAPMWRSMTLANPEVLDEIAGLPGMDLQAMRTQA